MDTKNQHFTIQKENEGLLHFYTLAPGIRISFNEIHTSSWEKGDSSLYGERMLILNFCVHGRCDASLAQNRYAIVKENQVCLSTILPTKDFYYPGRLYEGIQFYLDLDILHQETDRTFSHKWAFRRSRPQQCSAKRTGSICIG